MGILKAVGLALGRTLGYGLLGLALAEGSCVVKNLLQLDPAANLEHRITSSDMKQARHLQSLVEGPLDDFSRLEVMEKFHVPSESMLLTMAFSSYALTNMALSDPKYREMAAAYIDRAVQKSLQPRIPQHFSLHFRIPIGGDIWEVEPLLRSPHNVLYKGHLNLMMGAYTLISGDKKYASEQALLTETLTEDFLSDPTHHLQSYTGNRWPADNVVALASLRLYDHLYGTDHSSVFGAWKEWSREFMMDKHGLLYSHIDQDTRLPDEEPRGCAIAYSIPFIHLFDPAFATDLYDSFKRTMQHGFIGIPFFRESMRDGYHTNVDSGPILLDRGTVASAFAIGAAKISGDARTFRRLSYAAEALTLPYETTRSKGYFANISLGEAVLLYGRTLKPWI